MKYGKEKEEAVVFRAIFFNSYTTAQDRTIWITMVHIIVIVTPIQLLLIWSTILLTFQYRYLQIESCMVNTTRLSPWTTLLGDLLQTTLYTCLLVNTTKRIKNTNFAVQLSPSIFWIIKSIRPWHSAPFQKFRGIFIYIICWLFHE